MREIHFDSENFYWKEIIVNVFLAVILTLKMAGAVESVTFLNFYEGVGMYSFFAANLNTVKNSLSDFETCRIEAKNYYDVTQIVECQQILIPAYLYTLSAISIALAVIYFVFYTISVAGNRVFEYFCVRERRSDL